MGTVDPWTIATSYAHCPARTPVQHLQAIVVDIAPAEQDLPYETQHFPETKNISQKLPAVTNNQMVSVSAAEVPPTPRGAHDWIKCKWGKLAGWLSCPGCGGIL